MRRKEGDLKLNSEEIDAAFRDPNWAARFPPVMSLDQVAELLQIPKATLYTWSSRGLLAGCSRKMGKHVRIFRDRLLAKAFNEGIQSNE